MPFDSHGVKRKQIYWLDPVGVQIRGIRLKSADNYAGGGTAIVDGRMLGSSAGERTALHAALSTIAINSSVNPPVRQLSGSTLYDGSNVQRGILANRILGTVTDALATSGYYITDPANGQSYLVNRIRVRDAITHDAINDNDGNEVWGILTCTAATTDVRITFYSGDTEANPTPYDIKTSTWYLTPPIGNTNNNIEIIFNESVEFEDRPFGHNLRDVMNFFDVSFSGGNMPIAVYTDADPTNTIGNPTISIRNRTLTQTTEMVDAVTIQLTVLEAARVRVGSRIGLALYNPGLVQHNTAFITNVNFGTGLVTIGAQTNIVGAADIDDTSVGTIKFDSGITEWVLSDVILTGTSLSSETVAGEKTTVEGYVNGLKYQVVRSTVPTNTSNGMSLSTDPVETDFYIGGVTTEAEFAASNPPILGGGSTVGLRLWWLDLSFANPDSRMEITSDTPNSDFDEVYFTIHYK